MPRPRVKRVTKESEITAIVHLVGIPDPGLDGDSSVPTFLFGAVCERLGLEATGTMPQQAQRIITAANLPYRADFFDGRGTSPAEGSVVTVAGLQQIKTAVLVLTD